MLSLSGTAAHLLLVDLDDVSVLHFQLLGRLLVVYATAVEEEAKGRDRNALAITV